MPELNLKFQPFPVLETERLILRHITKADSDVMLKLRSDVAAMRYLDRPIAVSIDDVHALLRRMDDDIDNNDGVSWGLELKQSGQLIGTLGYYRLKKEHFRGEIGYMLFPSHWRKGLMSEAMHRVMDYGFNTLGFHSIEADINPDNEASKGILLKMGFVQEAYFKENCFYEGKFLDTMIFSMLKKDFK